MKRFLILTIIIFVFLTGCKSTNSNLVSQKTNTWAVLCAQEDYTNVPRITSLGNLTNGHLDIYRFQGMLEYFGWNENQIHKQLDTVTRENVTKELDWLIKNVKEDDTVLFYYLGHGSYLSTEVEWSKFFDDKWKQISGKNRILIIASCQAEGKTKIVKNEEQQHITIASVSEDENAWGGMWNEGLPIIGGVFNYYFVEAHYNPLADTNNDGKVSIQEAFYWADVEQRNYMENTVYPDNKDRWGHPTAVMENTYEEEVFLYNWD